MENLIILIGGIVIGTLGATLGATMFIAAPFWQIMFPHFTYGQILGNLKIGSFTRGIASTWSTRKKIKIKETLVPSALLALGTIISSLFIADLDQKYLLVAVVFSIVISELSPKIAHLITPRTRLICSFLIGIYMGILGAGTSLLLIALMRTIYKKPEELATAKIQALFIETIGITAATIILLSQSTLVYPYWAFWAIGSFIGGYIGGNLLNKTIQVSGKLQRIFLILVYIAAILPFLIKYLF